MKHRRNGTRPVLAAGIAGLLAVLPAISGCEKDGKIDDAGAYLDESRFDTPDRDESGWNALAVTPRAATGARIGQQINFKARGGAPPYNWSVADGGNGSLQVNGWSEAVYTVRRVGANSVTVTDQRGHAAIAQVDGAQVDDAVTALTAEADPDVLRRDGDKTVLTASGGSPPYRWAVLDAALGHIIGVDTGESVVYMRAHNGDNVVRVRDADGRGAVFNVRIEQP